ncbi:hypothetical protein QE152_g15216 [Popillia japonica]|uniref:Uncharacterized protein n=1 Tax=Popillia japonica TaxID=7064 RepID=A0AAW1L8X1_POPJA
MLKYILSALVIIPCINCSLKNAKGFFVYEDAKETSLVDNCYSLLDQQYYWQNISNNNISDITKLDCLNGNLSKDKYFPKCCPPNYVYHKRHHKCHLNDTTNIYDVFGEENLLIRSGLNCTVILDNTIMIDGNDWVINADRSLNFGGRSYRLGDYCLDNHLDNDNELILRTCEAVDVCRKNNLKCIKKCCADGYFYKGTKCTLGPYFGLSLENNTRFLDKSESFDAVVISEPCRRYIGKSIFNYSIASNGTTSINERGAWRQIAVEENYYCMEYVQLTNKHEILLCMIDARLEPEFGAKGVMMVISCICLILTVCGYFILPDLKNLIGNIVITYCICLTVAFISLIYLQFNPNPGKPCVYLGFTISFLFVTAFTWMTILSYEIWRVLG